MMFDDQGAAGPLTAPTSSPLAVLLGHTTGADAVYAELDEERPHLRIAASIGGGRSTQMRAAVAALATQIPDRGRSRMFLIETDSLDSTFGGLDRLPGVVVAPPGRQAAAVADIWTELARRDHDMTTEPFVIAIDNLWQATPDMHDLVARVEDGNALGVHLVVGGNHLGDFDRVTGNCDRVNDFKNLVRAQIWRGRKDGWAMLVTRARAHGVGWRPPLDADLQLIMYGIGVEDSPARFGLQGYLSQLEEYMFYDLLPHPDKYTTVILRATEMPVSRHLPFVARYPELARGNVAFAAVSAKPTAFTPTAIDVHPWSF